MTKEGFKRKLTAIFSADVKGYSRLMREDEVATVDTLRAYRKAMSALIQKHRGRVVDTPGDNLLAEFGSVVDAVQCAVEVQQELKARNAELPENRRMEFRIGINLGDVIEEEERIYGDGVNVAARVEGLAEAGGICISGTVYDSIEGKLPLGYEYLGEHAVKNIPKPVRVYRILMEPEAAGSLVYRRRRYDPRHRQRATFVLAAVLVAAVVAVAIWNFYLRASRPTVEPASVEKVAVPLPDKPSIAVLPFSNLSGDPGQEYFSDGITNDMITDLSKFRGLFVIASNTVFTYKGKPVKVKDLGRELGVRYVLEGSVQRGVDKVRVNAQLIDTTTGHHLWAERYERGLKDLFTMQDEIVQTIVARLAVKVRRAERARVMRKATDSLEAYDYVLRGYEYLSRGTRSANMEAKEMFQRAIELDPHYAETYAGLGWVHYLNAGFGWTEFPAKALQQAHDFAQKALSLEELNDSAHRLLGSVYLYRGQHDLAVNELQRAIELNPNDARSHRRLGQVMLYSSRTDEAIHSLETGVRLDPNIWPGFMFLGLAYYLKERYDDAIRTLERGLARKPDSAGTHIALAAAYAQSGRSEDAAREAVTVLRLDPFFEVDSYGTAFRNPADRASIADGLRKAGLK